MSVLDGRDLVKPVTCPVSGHPCFCRGQCVALVAERDRYRDLLERIHWAIKTRTIELPDVDAAIEADLDEALA